MAYKIAFVGTGARAVGHACAYELIPNWEFVGCFGESLERRKTFARRYDMPDFSSLDKLLKTTEPDLVHITTPPAVRVAIMQAVSDAHIAACTVEKPIAIAVADWRQLNRLAEITETRFGVCHQFRWHPDLSQCREAISSGQLGKILLLEASAGMTITDQGTHAMHYANSLNGDSRVMSVFGAVSGWAVDSRHPGPHNAVAYVEFENGVRLQWLIGPIAPNCGDPSLTWQHVRVAAFLEHGRVLWEEFGNWIIQSGSEIKQGKMEAHRHGEFNKIAQARFHGDMLEWLECPDKPVGTNLKRSLHEWKAVLALYESALRRHPIQLDSFDPKDDLVSEIKSKLVSS